MKIDVSGKRISMLRAKSRTSRGAYLLELLAALTVSALFAVALSQGIGQTKVAAFGGHSRILAQTAQQAIIDRLRSLPWSIDSQTGLPVPPLQVGEIYSIRVNSSDSMPSGSAAPWQTRPLICDLTPNAYYWPNVSSNSLLPMTAQVVASNCSPYSSWQIVQCDITVKIKAGTDGNWAPFTVSTLLSATGVHPSEAF